MNPLRSLFVSQKAYSGTSALGSLISAYLREGDDATLVHSEDVAYRIAAVMACVRLISETVGSLPLHAFQRTDGGKARVPVTNSLERLLQKPNPWQTPLEFREQLTAHLLLRGNGYAYIDWQTALLEGRIVDQAVGLYPLPPDQVEVVRRDDNYRAGLQYFLHRASGGKIELPAEEVLHLKGLSSDGVCGRSVLSDARETFAGALSTQRYSTHLFENDATPGVVLQHPTRLTDEVAARIRRSWDSTHAGPRNARRTAVLEEGMTVSKLSVTPDEAQFLECVAPGTLVSMADGTRRKAEELRPGDRVVGWADGPVAARVAAVGTPPEKALIRIRTARGRELVASYDHPVLAKRALRTAGGRPDNSEPAWVHAGKLEVGAYVQVGLGVPAGAVFEPMAHEEAYFLGAMIGDGYIRKLGCSFTTEDTGVLAAVRNSAQSMGGDLVGERDTARPYDYRIHTGGVGKAGSPIRTLLNRSGAVGSHAHTKRVPAIVMRGGPETWSAFLSGYLDTDGSVGRIGGTQQPKVYWSSVSRELLDDCQHLLAGLGINAAVYAMAAGGRRMVVGHECEARPSWGLFVTGAESLRALSALLTPAHSVKAERLAQYATLPITRYRGDNWRYDRVTAVEFVGFGETVGVEIEGVHTHVTAGLVTHNTRKYQRSEIAGLFRVPGHLIGDIETSTSWGTGIEQQQIGFLVYTIRPWLIRWEQAIKRSLIIREDTMFVEHLVEGLLRGDVASRYEAYVKAVNNAIFTPNEIRAMENQNPSDDPGADRLYRQASVVPIDTPVGEAGRPTA